MGVDCWFWPHARESSARGPLQGLCACCPRAGSAPEVGEEGRCTVAVSLLPCPVARAVARVSWTPGGELRAAAADLAGAEALVVVTRRSTSTRASVQVAALDVGRR